MKIFYCGDVVARPGREAILNNLENIKQQYKPDVIIINADNAAHGFGVTPGIARDFFAKGADAILCGNHVWNQKDIIPFINDNKKIIRPLNYGEGHPGRGFCEVTLPNGRIILIIQVVGRVYMEAVDCPVKSIDNLLKSYNLSKTVDAIFVDIHAEATSEKQAFGHYFDGRVSAVIGSHTHVPTMDYKILPNGTAYMTDVGMCGDYDGVIGFEKEEPVARIARKYTGGRLIPCKGKGTLSAVLIETDDKTGLAINIEYIKI